MHPAHQGLESDQLARRTAYLRLVTGENPVPIQRLAYVLFRNEPPHGLQAHVLVEHDKTASRRFLRRIQRGLCIVQQLCGVVRMVGKHHQAGARGATELRAMRRDRSGQAPLNGFNQINGTVRRADPVQYQAEFVASNASSEIGFTNARPDTGRCFDQNRVACPVPISVICIFQVIDIQNSQSQCGTVVPCRLERTFQRAFKECAVGNSRQGVVICQGPYVALLSSQQVQHPAAVFGQLIARARMLLQCQPGCHDGRNPAQFVQLARRKAPRLSVEHTQCPDGSPLDDQRNAGE